MPANAEIEAETLDGGDIPEYRPDNVDVEDPSGDDGTVEEQARALGWKPEDEFKGDKSKWTDADSFLETHSRNNGALRKAVAAQAADLAELKAQMRGMDSAHKKIFEIQIKKQKDEFDQQVAFLKAQKREALRSGEHETAADIDEQLDGLRERGPELPDLPETTPKNIAPGQWRTNADMVEWAKGQPWFDVDEDMTLYAGTIGKSIRESIPSMAFPKLLDQVAERVRKAFPHKFQAGRRSPVEGATPGASSAVSTGKSYNSLPKDAKAACDEAVADGGLTQKQWVDLYFGYDDRRKR